MFAFYGTPTHLPCKIFVTFGKKKKKEEGKVPYLPSFISSKLVFNLAEYPTLL